MTASQNLDILAVTTADDGGHRHAPDHEREAAPDHVDDAGAHREPGLEMIAVGAHPEVGLRIERAALRVGPPGDELRASREPGDGVVENRGDLPRVPRQDPAELEEGRPGLRAAAAPAPTRGGLVRSQESKRVVASRAPVVAVLK